MTDLELADEIERRRDSDARGYAQLALSYSQWQQIIAALRRGPKRPPSGEMVMVPRELTPAMHEAGLRFAGTLHANYEDCWKALLSAASGANFVLRVSPEKLKEIQDEFTSRIIQPEVKP